ncbi:MAG: Glutamate--tRNA ligase [Candidatus Kapaibacterium sp.]|nr:MAG: Glutamate--tRNA ligase [Candidatus Kapabacteria bacterium]
MSVRVRFAPSPTGYLHVGGLRTALYNYFFARKHNGKLILRIEDTDRTRYVEGSVENLIKTLTWAGIEFDEGPHIGGPYGPYYQSQRLEIYRKHADLLIEKGWAYYAFDTPEELEEARQKSPHHEFKYDRYSMRNQFTLGIEKTHELISQGVPYVIRLKVPDNQEIQFYDIIRGEISVNSKDVDDQILLKSDGYPTYHLANVVDDHLMEITHIIRGEEWLPSVPKHILLYNAFGWEIPKLAHLPLLLNKDRTKLSKRQGDVAVEDYIAKGYFPEAFVNFIALLGWNPSADREIYSVQELIDKFELEKVNKAGAIFDVVKLDAINAKYLYSKPIDELASEFRFWVEQRGYFNLSDEYLRKVVALLRERVKKLPEIIDFAPYMFEKPKQYDLEYFKKHWSDTTKEHLENILNLLRTIEDFTHQTVHDEVLKYLNERNLKLKEVIHPLRLAITGLSYGAGMFETMEVLGKDEVIQRLEYFLQNILPEIQNEKK